jgi:hypothetical protein
MGKLIEKEKNIVLAFFSVVAINQISPLAFNK